MERWRFAAAFLTAILVGGRAAAAGADEDRTEALLEIIRAAMAGAAASPSVLAGIDVERETPDVRRLVRILEETTIDLTVEKATVVNVVDLLRKASEVNFAISVRARKAIEEEKPEVSISLRRISLENALDLLALHLEGYRFSIQYGAVFLLRADEVRPKVTIRFYDVTDLLRKPTDFPAPPLALSEPGEKSRS